MGQDTGKRFQRKKRAGDRHYFMRRKRRALIQEIHKMALLPQIAIIAILIGLLLPAVQR